MKNIEIYYADLDANWVDNYVDIEDGLIQLVKKSAYDALNVEFDKLRGLVKDHEDDWKRIQDAERALEKAQAKAEGYRAILMKLVASVFDGDDWICAGIDDAAQEARKALEEGN